MIHAYLSIVKKAVKDTDPLEYEKNLGVSFYGAKEECKNMSEKFVKEKSAFVQIEKGNAEQLNAQFLQIIQWFAENEFIPAGSASGERIFYK